MKDNSEKWINPADSLIELWNPMQDNEKELIRQNIDTRHYNKNDSLYTIGEQPLLVRYVISGRVKIFRNSDDGRPKIIRMFCDGQFFSYRAFFAQELYTTSCVAMEDTYVATLPVNVIDRLICSNKNVMTYFLKQLALGLGLSDDRVVSMAQKHLRGRLAETLMFISRSFGTDEEGWIHGKITRSDIANLANMTTSNAIRTLTAFRDEGLIDTDGKKIRISKPNELAYISGKE